MSPDRYTVTAADAHDCEPLAAAAWQAGHAHSGGPVVDGYRARFRWFYRENPAGQATVHFLNHAESSRPVGMLAIAPRLFEYAGRGIRAGLLFDFVVAPEHRTGFPALLLQRRAHASALQSGPLYGLPAESAVPILQRLQARIRTARPRFARVVRSRTYLARLIPLWLATLLSWFVDGVDWLTLTMRLLPSRATCEWVDTPDRRIDAIWAEARDPAMVMGVRTGEFLRWRFFTHEPGRFRALLVGSGDASAPHTYFVCELRDGTLAVRDLLSAGTRRELTAALLTLAREARRRGADHVSVNLLAGGRYLQALEAAGFRQREDQPCFIYLPGADAEALASASWYLTTADEDV